MEVLEAWFFHQTRAEADPRGLVLHQGSVGVVLEAWYYTRAAGTDVVHGATTGWIPTAARGVDLQGAVINTWGSVGDGSDWYTGGLVYWYFLKHKWGHNFHFILFSHSLNLSIIFATDSFVYRLSLLNLFITVTYLLCL